MKFELLVHDHLSVVHIRVHISTHYSSSPRYTLRIPTYHSLPTMVNTTQGVG